MKFAGLSMGRKHGRLGAAGPGGSTGVGWRQEPWALSVPLPGLQVKEIPALSASLCGYKEGCRCEVHFVRFLRPEKESLKMKRRLVFSQPSCVSWEAGQWVFSHPWSI